MLDVLEQVNRIAAAPSVAAVWDLAVAHFASHGFARVNYGMTRFRKAGGIGDPDDAVYLTSFPASYSNFYFRDGFYARTAPYRWALENRGSSCTWRWVEEKARAGLLAPDELEAVQRNAQWQLRAGVTISFPDVTTRQRGAIGLAGDPGLDHDQVDAIWAEHGLGLEAVAHVMHLRLCQLPLPVRRPQLSQRQREALEWVTEGKTMQDIATLMGISTAMVEKHLRLARQALDVDSTAQAVAKAALLNQIFLPAAPPQVRNPLLT